MDEEEKKDMENNVIASRSCEPKAWQEAKQPDGASTEGEPSVLSRSCEPKAWQEAKDLMAEKDARIAELEGQLTGLTEQLEGKTKEMEEAAAKLANVSGSLDTAVARYLGVAKALNPSVPGDIIGGGTIEEIDASVEKGNAIVGAVRKAMEAEAAAGKVPAGAPERGGVSTEGMSPREKIAAGIK